MGPVFLIGGGWAEESFQRTYGRFLKAAERGTDSRIAVIVAREDDASDPHIQFLRFRGALERSGLEPEKAFELVVSGNEPLASENIAGIEPSGILVCGGLTPAYYDGLCLDTRWLKYLRDNDIPYCGFSAGAAIAADKAIIGGWLREQDGRTVQIADENAGEDLDLLDVRSGLNLVGHSIEVHATQWGTLSRLVHAVDAGLTQEGLAIDENTMLAFDGPNVTVHGIGSVYRVAKSSADTTISIMGPAAD